MTGILFVTPLCLMALPLLLSIPWQLAKETAEHHAAPRWVPDWPTVNNPDWPEYDRQALSQAAAEASRQIAHANALANWEWDMKTRLRVHFDWSAWQVPEPIPVEYLPRRELVAA